MSPGTVIALVGLALSVLSSAILIVYALGRHTKASEVIAAGLAKLETKLDGFAVALAELSKAQAVMQERCDGNHGERTGRTRLASIHPTPEEK